MASVTWQCPRCGRRVPNRAEECHCGMTRQAALDAARAAPAAAEPTVSGRSARSGPGAGGTPSSIPSAYKFSWRGLPRDIKLMTVGLVLLVVVGLTWLVVVPYRPKPIVPLLGWSEPTSPRKPASPPPKSTPRKGAQP